MVSPESNFGKLLTSVLAPSFRKHIVAPVPVITKEIAKPQSPNDSMSIYLESEKKIIEVPKNYIKDTDNQYTEIVQKMHRDGLISKKTLLKELGYESDE